MMAARLSRTGIDASVLRHCCNACPSDLGTHEAANLRRKAAGSQQSSLYSCYSNTRATRKAGPLGKIAVRPFQT